MCPKLNYLTVFFAAALSWLAWVGVVIGAVAVWLLSLSHVPHTGRQPIGWQTLVIGLGSGLGFALCTLFIREAALILRHGGLNFLLSAGWVLFFVLLIQSVLLTAWLVVREPATLPALYRQKKLTAGVSVFSFFGSVGWFTAMSLQSVAMVKTLGQIEVLFTLGIAVYWFKDKLARSDYIGLGLIVIAAVLVMLA
ncbi:MAG: hypothetical protein CR974_00220 [Gammaproteobacteria bacterium]|nr:MAG: hypothetical protein CR974_00220 [Gammaproteobacteria bacterium]